MTRDFANALRRVHVVPAHAAPAGAGSDRSLHKAGSPSRPRRPQKERGKPHHASRHEPQRQDSKQEPKDEP
jgi:hypothetical protein